MPTVKNLFRSRTERHFDYSNIIFTGVLPNICEALPKYGLFDYLELRFDNSVFFTYSSWKTTVWQKSSSEPKCSLVRLCLNHHDLKQADYCLGNIPWDLFWSLANHCPDPVSRLHVQVRIMGNFRLNGSVLWLTGT